MRRQLDWSAALHCSLFGTTSTAGPEKAGLDEAMSRQKKPAHAMHSQGEPDFAYLVNFIQARAA